MAGLGVVIDLVDVPTDKPLVITVRVAPDAKTSALLDGGTCLRLVEYTARREGKASRTQHCAVSSLGFVPGRQCVIHPRQCRGRSPP